MSLRARLKKEEDEEEQETCVRFFYSITPSGAAYQSSRTAVQCAYDSTGQAMSGEQEVE